MNIKSLFIYFTLALTAFQSPVFAQNEEISENDVIRVNTSLVQFSLRATDRRGRPVLLNQEQLKVFADGKEQKLVSFRVEPIQHYVVIVDTSTSVRGYKFKRLCKALHWLINAADSKQTFEFYTFADKVNRVGTASARDAHKLIEQIEDYYPDGETALYDSVTDVTKAVKNSGKHFALVIFTDGEDTLSKTNAEQLEKELAVKGYLTYLILFNNQMVEIEPLKVKDDGVAQAAGEKFQKIFQSVLYIVQDMMQLREIMNSIPKEAGVILHLAFQPDDKTAFPGKHQIVISYDFHKTLDLTHRETYYIESQENAFRQGGK